MFFKSRFISSICEIRQPNHVSRHNLFLLVKTFGNTEGKNSYANPGLRMRLLYAIGKCSQKPYMFTSRSVWDTQFWEMIQLHIDRELSQYLGDTEALAVNQSSTYQFSLWLQFLHLSTWGKNLAISNQQIYSKDIDSHQLRRWPRIYCELSLYRGNHPRYAYSNKSLIEFE